MPRLTTNKFDRTEAGADRKFAGRLFLDGDVDNGPVGGGPAHFLDGDVLEETKGAQIVARPLQQGAVEGIPFGQRDLTTDDRVDGAGVADDIDPLDIDPLSFGDIEGHIHQPGLRVGGIGRVDLDEGIAGRAGGEGQGVDGPLDLVALVQVAGVDRQQLLEEITVQPVAFRNDPDLAEIVFATFIDGDGHAKCAVVRGQLGDRGHDAEIIIAAVGIEFPQLLAVIIQPVGVVVVVGREEIPPDRLLGHHDLAQIVILEGGIAQEGDGSDARLRAFIDLEHDVDAVLLQLNQLRRDRRRNPARQPVQLNQLADIFLDTGAGIDAARTDRDLLAQLGLGDRAVPLEHHLVDDRVFDDIDDQVAVLGHAQLNVGEQACAVQRTHSDVEHDRIDRVARLDRQIGQDRGLIDPLVAAHHDAVDDGSLFLTRSLGTPRPRPGPSGLLRAHPDRPRPPGPAGWEPVTPASGHGYRDGEQRTHHFGSYGKPSGAGVGS